MWLLLFFLFANKKSPCRFTPAGAFGFSDYCFPYGVNRYVCERTTTTERVVSLRMLIILFTRFGFIAFSYF